MRISDWSSDVCSSDLSRGDLTRDVATHPVGNHQTGWPVGLTGFVREQGVLVVLSDHALVGGRAPEVYHRTDRKSVAKGKSVSVLVDLGGRGILIIKNFQCTIFRRS